MKRAMIRELSEEQVRERFLDNVRDIVDYWSSDKIVCSRSIHERLSGVAFSILSSIDCCSFNIPGFILAPYPHEDDRQFHISRFENYYPDNNDSNIKCDIGGCLHEQFYNNGIWKDKR